MLGKIFLISISACAFLWQGCLRTYYPAVYQTSASPIIFQNPGAIDTIGRFGSVDYSTARGQYSDELFQMLRFGYLRVDTHDNFNFNSGINVYTGNYRVSGVSFKYDGTKNFIGVAGIIKFNINFKIKNFKMGIGSDIGVGFEFGDYYNFRKSAGDENLISSDNTKLIQLYLSVFPIFNYKFSETTNLSMQMNIGVPGVLSPCALLNNDDYVYWISWIPNREARATLYSERIVFGFMMSLNKLSL